MKIKLRKVFSMEKTEVKIQVNGCEIKRTPEHKYLGKIVEEELKDKKEIQERIKMAKIQSNECMSIINKIFYKSRKRIEMCKELLQK